MQEIQNDAATLESVLYEWIRIYAHTYTLHAYTMTIISLKWWFKCDEKLYDSAMRFILNGGARQKGQRQESRSVASFLWLQSQSTLVVSVTA